MENPAPGLWSAEDPAAVLDVVLGGMQSSGIDALCLLRPLRDGEGALTDFLIVADTGVLARLSGTPTVGRTVREVFAPDFADELVALNGRALDTGTVIRSDRVVPVVGREPAPVIGRVVDDHDVSVGEVVRVPIGEHVLVIGRDVTEDRKTARALALSEDRYRRLLENSTDPVLVTDRDGVVTYASPPTAELTRRPLDAVLGMRVGMLAHPQDADAVNRLLASAAHGGDGYVAREQVRLLDDDGAVRWIVVTATNRLEDHIVSGMVINVRDVTEQVEAAARLQQEAMQDSLTGLPNRRWFLRAVHDAASRSARTGRPFAVLLVDVDNFKAVNDDLGHHAGDELLIEMAGRMTAALRDSDTVARLGGDEFIVLAEDLDDVRHADDLAGRLLDHVAGLYRLAPGPVTATVSVGVATSGRGAAAGSDAAPPAASAGGRTVTDVQQLLQQADAAMYAAKRAGRHCARSFDGLEVAERGQPADRRQRPRAD